MSLADYPDFVRLTQNSAPTVVFANPALVVAAAGAVGVFDVHAYESVQIGVTLGGIVAPLVLTVVQWDSTGQTYELGQRSFVLTDGQSHEFVLPVIGGGLELRLAHASGAYPITVNLRVLGAGGTGPLCSRPLDGLILEQYAVNVGAGAVANLPFAVAWPGRAQLFVIGQNATFNSDLAAVDTGNTLRRFAQLPVQAVAGTGVVLQQVYLPARQCTLQIQNTAGAAQLFDAVCIADLTG